MKKPQNIVPLIFAGMFLAFLINSIGKADTMGIAMFSLAIFSMLLFFIASNMKPKNKKDKEAGKANPDEQGGI